MPLPKPTKREDKDNFLSRCMSDDVMKKDFPDNDKRFAVCTQQWEKGKGESMKEQINQDTEKEVRGILEQKSNRINVIRDLIGKDNFNEDTKQEILGLISADIDSNEMLLNLLGEEMED